MDAMPVSQNTFHNKNIYNYILIHYTCTTVSDKAMDSNADALENSIAQFQEEQQALLEEQMGAAQKQINEIHVSLNKEEEKLPL